MRCADEFLHQLHLLPCGLPQADMSCRWPHALTRCQHGLTGTCVQDVRLLRSLLHCREHHIRLYIRFTDSVYQV